MPAELTWQQRTLSQISAVARWSADGPSAGAAPRSRSARIICALTSTKRWTVAFQAALTCGAECGDPATARSTGPWSRQSWTVASIPEVRPARGSSAMPSAIALTTISSSTVMRSKSAISTSSLEPK